ncbi:MULTISPECIES: hypothetical protein [Burkholderia]|uniref:hypothetical protein n=1 Tax=Burkholderia TaxID=32008 RepID=UPI000BF3E8D0|nr:MULTISPECIES: hypothetical protein [Burkholderia]PFH26722.1 hypothetical protein BX604_0424 [Burkholderia sp. JKS000303]
MRKALLLSFVPAAIALAAACPFMPAYADESVTPDHAMLLAESTLNARQDDEFDVMFVAAPQPLSSNKSSVTLWDEITPPAPLPMPIPAPRPGDMQHAMAGSAGSPLRQ